MDARLSPPSPRHRRPWAVRPPTLVVFGLLLLTGTLIQACSDNNGSTGPTFECREQKGGGAHVLAQCTASPAPTTGFADSNIDIFVQVQASPASVEPGRRVSIIVIVTNGALGAPASTGGIGGSGQPLPGKKVFIIPSAGSVDAPSGITNGAGVYQTTLLVRCEDLGPITVNASVDGAVSLVGAVIVVTPATPNTPC